MKKSSYEIICSYMPQRIKTAMVSAAADKLSNVNEVRIRVNRPVVFVYADRYRFLCSGGLLAEKHDAENCIIPTAADIEYIVKSLCRFSVHSCQKELSQGFFTIDNGIRVGLAGTLTSSADKTLKYISSLNFRIAREIIGCAGNLASVVLANGLKSVLVSGGVNSGKTTMLRDLCRICGSGYKTVLIDERSEISAPVCGIPSHQIGTHTDVLENYERADGIISAVRTLSPQVIFCDEISTNHDAEAIMNGFGSGVKFIASVHADSIDSLIRRPVIAGLITAGVFDYAVQLQGESFPGTVREIRRLPNHA